jgi:hypothetical protein
MAELFPWDSGSDVNLSEEEDSIPCVVKSLDKVVRLKVTMGTTLEEFKQRLESDFGSYFLLSALESEYGTPIPINTQNDFKIALFEADEEVQFYVSPRTKGCLDCDQPATNSCAQCLSKLCDIHTRDHAQIHAVIVRKGWDLTLPSHYPSLPLNSKYRYIPEPVSNDIEICKKQILLASAHLAASKLTVAGLKEVVDQYSTRLLAQKELTKEALAVGQQLARSTSEGITTQSSIQQSIKDLCEENTLLNAWRNM